MKYIIPYRFLRSVIWSQIVFFFEYVKTKICVVDIRVKKENLKYTLPTEMTKNFAASLVSPFTKTFTYSSLMICRLSWAFADDTARNLSIIAS